jgi:dihydropyrimidinase
MHQVFYYYDCNCRWNKSTSDEMKVLCDEFGVNTFVVLMAFKDQYQLNDTDLYEIFERCKEIGALCQVHAENGDIIAKNVEKLIARGQTGADAHDLSRDAEVEAEAVNRACVIAHQAEAPVYITKVSSKLAADQISFAKRRGAKVYGEILVASIGCKPSNPSIYTLTSPPLRLKDPENAKLLLKHLALDDLQVVASGNCTFSKAQKEENKGDFTLIPHGVNGAGDRMKIVWEKCVATNIIDLQKFVAITSTNAAKLFNLYPKKGSISVGSDADIVIWNHQANQTITAKNDYHANDYNIFEGVKVSGAPEYVVVKGKVCYEDENVRVAEGYGNFIELPPNCGFIYAQKNGSSNNNNNNEVRFDELDQFQEEFEDRDYVPEKADSIRSTSTQVTHTARAPRPEGQRDMQSSSFSISKGN